MQSICSFSWEEFFQVADIGSGLVSHAKAGREGLPRGRWSRQVSQQDLWHWGWGGCQPNMRTLFPASTSSAFEFTPGPCSGRLWICIDLNSNLQAKMMEFASWIDKFCPVNPRPALILSMSWTWTLPHRFVTILEEVWIESFESLFKRLFDKNLWFAELFKNYQADMTLWFTFHISKRFWTAPFDLTAWSLILRNFAHDLLNGDPFRDQGVCSKGFVQNFWD